ncbi:MAG: hypothetical protein ABI702_05430 [Burkholderiales bacterium]
MNASFNDPHQVIVTVDTQGIVACTPENVAVRGCDTVLKFVLQTKGYVFPEKDAIVVDKPGQQFPFPSRTLPKQPTKATLYDHNSAHGDFKYTVYVRDVATGKILELDPMISNGD